MKRTLFIIMICIVGILSLTGCINDEKDVTSDKISIVTTIFPQYDFSRQITGDLADVKMLLKPGAETHSYEPSPADIKMIQNADLFIYTGGENDKWVENILESMGNKKPKAIRILDLVTVLPEEIIEGMQDDEHDDEKESDKHEEEIDEHVWTSPKNAIKIVEGITAVVSEIDKKNASAYKENSKKYVSKLMKLHNDFKEVLDNKKQKTLVFGDRFPFRYFTEEYGLDYLAAFPGCATQTDASASTVAFLIDKVKEKQIPVVFKIEFSNGKIAQSISDATGAKVLTLHSSHNVTKDEFDRGVTYLSIMEQNVKTLKEALK